MSAPTESVRYGPKVDPFPVIAVGLAVLAMVAAAVAIALDPGVDRSLVLLVVVVYLLAIGAMVAVGYPIAYEVDAHEVRVRAGLLRQRVVLAELARVALVTSVFSSTSASWTMRRVQLVDRDGRVVEVGPTDRIGFVAEVVARAPQLVEDQNAGKNRAWHDPNAR